MDICAVNGGEKAVLGLWPWAFVPVNRNDRKLLADSITVPGAIATGTVF